MSVAPKPAVADLFWRSPLISAALAVTAGIVLDRCFSLSIPCSVGVLAVALLGWGMASWNGNPVLPLVFLAVVGIALGAARHHLQRNGFADDDIGNFAPEEPRPVQLRGILADEPTRMPAIVDDPLRSRDRPSSSAVDLVVLRVLQPEGWTNASGCVRMLVDDSLRDLHAGDRIEVDGRLARLKPPSNPGEFDQADALLDRGIRAQLQVRSGGEAVVRIERGWTSSLVGMLAVVRGWGQSVLDRELSTSTRALASALLLGETSSLTTAEWDRYQRTGVVHVLAISGQHLTILAGVLWFALRIVELRQRQGAALVALTLFGYALLTGGRPPALRAAVMVSALALATILRRRTLPANALALGWLTVVLLHPADVFHTGCQLSFLAVAVLYWGVQDFSQFEHDPLQQVINESRPVWQRGLLRVGRRIGELYLATALVWLALTPLVAARYHLVAPIGILLGPPIMLLTSIALTAGFLLLLSAAILPPLATLFALPVEAALSLSSWLVDVGERVPGGYWYVGDISAAWLAVTYAGLLAMLTQSWLRRHWHWGVVAGLGWLCLGMLGSIARWPTDELRCTFLAVGHGGCTILETPDGRTLLYDAGAIAGPEVARRQIAPFLWHRGVQRIDEIFLSHGDLDHFNGLPDLLDRFTIGLVTCTPTFANRSTRAVAYTLEALERKRIPTRVARAGDWLAAGPVSFEVLHPPADGVPGNENARSLVLLVRHGDLSLLLTGDLEGAGLDRLLALPARRVTVLQAPHHGSRLTNPPDLAAWARPRVVVACQGPPVGRRAPLQEPYSRLGARFLGTWPHGAITLRSPGRGLIVETYATGERFVVHRVVE